MAPASAVVSGGGFRGPAPQPARSFTPEVVATLSHEVRTPLDSITGYTEMLADGALEPHSPQWDDAIGRIQGSVRELLEWVGITFDVARLGVDELVRSRPPDTSHVASTASTTRSGRSSR